MLRTPAISRKTNLSITRVPKRNFVLTAGVSAVGATAAATAGVVAFAAYRYKVAPPDQYLVRTGLGIKDIAVSKQGFQWPFQKYKFIEMHPRNYNFQLHSMSNEKIPFILPGVFTIGPKNDMDALVRYVRIIENAGNERFSTQTLDSIILGILEGETRTLSSQMTMEEIFNDRQKFKATIIKNVQDELDQIGLWIYNANIKELEDSSESKYFFNVRQKKSSETENQARVAVAEAKKAGDIGQKEREAITRQQVAQYESETVLRENERRQEIEKSTADLEVVKAEAYRRRTVADIEARLAAEMRNTELQREVEQKRIATETEKLRVQDMAKAQVNAEARIKEAEGTSQALKLTADAQLYAKQAEAKGVQALLEAQAEGLNRIIGSFGGNADAYTRYLMVERDLYTRLAQANAEAIRGLEPKIVNWNTNGTGSNGVVDVLKMIPPLVSTIHDQTGIKPPSWLLDMTEKKNITFSGSFNFLRRVPPPVSAFLGKGLASVLSSNH